MMTQVGTCTPVADQIQGSESVYSDTYSTAAVHLILIFLISEFQILIHYKNRVLLYLHTRL